MLDPKRELAETLLDRAAKGTISRRKLLAAATSLGVLELVSPAAMAQAVLAGENQRKNRNSLLKSYDYIVVGAGSAGCAVAMRLATQSDATVLLIEAGPSDENVATISDPTRWLENMGSAYDWKYFYAPTARVDNRQILLSRGKVLGGSSSINALVWVRGNQADYDDWAAAGNPGWDYRSVLPLFKRSEDWEGGASDIHGAGGPIRVESSKNLHFVAQAFIEAGRSLGMPSLPDCSVARPLGVGPLNMNVRAGTRCSTARGYLRPVLDRKNLTVLTQAQVVKLGIIRSRCTGVDVLMDGTLRTIGADKEVVLSAGAIDTPRLLMLSGIGRAADLKAVGIAPVLDSPGVGQNLHDHVLIAGLCFETAGTTAPFNNNLEGATAFCSSRSGMSPDLMYVALQIPLVTPELGKRYPAPKTGFTIAPGLVRVKSRGYIKMHSAKFDGPLEIQPNFLAAQEDVEALLSSLEIGLELANQPALKQLITRWAAPTKKMSRADALQFLRLSTLPYYHPVGTCAMGTGKESVVDAKLHVRGIERLRVADASVMPAIPSANTNAPSVMIGEFAAQELLS